jgi:hypothetical protein
MDGGRDATSYCSGLCGDIAVYQTFAFRWRAARAKIDIYAFTQTITQVRPVKSIKRYGDLNNEFVISGDPACKRLYQSKVM